MTRAPGPDPGYALPQRARRAFALTGGLHRGERRLSEFALPAAGVMLAFLLPARLVVNGLGAAGRPAVVLGVGLAALWVFAQIHGGARLRASVPLRLLLGAYWVSLLLSYAAGYDRGLSSVESSSSDRSMIVVVGASGVMLVVAEFLRTRAALDAVLQAMVLGGAFMALMGVLQTFDVDLVQYIRVPGLVLNQQIIGVTERGAGGFARVAGTAGHYIEYGTVAAMLVPLAVHFWRRSGARTLGVWSCAVALLAVAVPFSVSRTSFLAAAVAVLVFSLGLGWRERLNFLLGGAVAVAAFQVVRPGVLGTVRSLFTNAPNDPSVTGRTDDYPVVFEYISQRPVLGRGAGTFEPSVYLVLDNQVLMTLLNTGIVGLVALLALVLGALVACRHACVNRVSDPVDRELGFALAAAISAAVVTSFTFDSLSFAVFSTVLWTCVGASFGLLRLVQEDGLRDPRRSGREVRPVRG